MFVYEGIELLKCAGLQESIVGLLVQLFCVWNLIRFGNKAYGIRKAAEGSRISIHWHSTITWHEVRSWQSSCRLSSQSTASSLQQSSTDQSFCPREEMKAQMSHIELIKMIFDANTIQQSFITFRRLCIDVNQFSLRRLLQSRYRLCAHEFSFSAVSPS